MVNISDQIILFSLERESDDMRFITPSTFHHFVAGIWLGSFLSLFGLEPIAVFLFASFIHLTYEIKDYIMMYKEDGSNSVTDYWNRNSYVNSIGDQLAAMLGALFFLSYNPVSISLSTFSYYTGFYAIVTVCFMFAYSVLRSG